MVSRLDNLSAQLSAALGDKIVRMTVRLGEVTIVVRAGQLIEAATMLRDAPQLRFEQLIDLCGVDYGSYGKSTWEGEPVQVEADAPTGGTAPAAGAAPGIDGTLAERAEAAAEALVEDSPLMGRRFAVVYHLLSVTHNWRVRVRVFAQDDEF